ncbi:cupin domain-containing protein [Streptomyces sp. NPDC051940]|uniref:cupin domain-containing protein n=1 Tax=Streptomyces sp. NPDC051940 TaxID=3155675 RepID=UPI003442C954
MHRTYSVDYGIVLKGEVGLELDGGDMVRLTAGDVVVQRGTNHMWFNDTDEPAVMSWVLIDTEPVVSAAPVRPAKRVVSSSASRRWGQGRQAARSRLPPPL